MNHQPLTHYTSDCIKVILKLLSIDDFQKVLGFIHGLDSDYQNQAKQKFDHFVHNYMLEVKQKFDDFLQIFNNTVGKGKGTLHKLLGMTSGSSSQGF